MDPLSQGVLGACAAQSGARRQELRVAGLVGLLGGMAPDLDVLVRSATDPLLFLEFHRQFSHALVFIPVGSLLVAIVLYPLFARKQLSFARTWLYAALGYATHGLLDACTTYGTQLYWPFSDARVAWNILPIIEPLFTVPILLLVCIAARRYWRLAAQLALVWALVVPLIGMVQRDRAEAVGWELAQSRGHQPLRLEAKPTFANLVLWKIVYETAANYHVDAVRVGLDETVYQGHAIPTLVWSRDLPWLDPASQQGVDVERFRWFSNGYIARHPQDPYQIIDIRYSLVPNEIDALWGILLNPAAQLADHAEYRVARNPSSSRTRRYWDMLTGSH